MIKRRGCGNKGLRSSGCKVVIKTKKFFHGLSTQRKRRNFVKGLGDGSGIWQEDEEVVSGMLIDFMLTYLLPSIHRT